MPPVNLNCSFFLKHFVLLHELSDLVNVCNHQCFQNFSRFFFVDFQGVWVTMVNLLFSVMVLFHLTYLGSMFDPGTDQQEVEEVKVSHLQSDSRFVLSAAVIHVFMSLKGYAAIHTIQRWSELNWAGHWAVVACWVFYRLIQ